MIQTVHVKLNEATGRIDVKTSGFVGPACQEIKNSLVHALDATIEREEATPEAALVSGPTISHEQTITGA